MKANMVAAINNALDLSMQENKDIVLLGEDIGKDGGVFRVTDGLQAKYGADRVMDTPLAESGILGTAIGMALGGMHPVPEVQFAGFMFLGFSQLVNHASRYRSRTRSIYPVPMVVRTPVSGGVKTLEHHSENPEAYYSHMGGLIVVEPSTPYDAKGLLIKALKMPDPVIFLEPTKLYRLFKEDIPDESYEVEIGKAKLVSEGSDLSIITYGTMVPVVKNVVEKKKVSADIIDLRTINPFDENAILVSAKKTGRVIIVHEASQNFGVGAEIAARIAEKAIFELKAPVMRVASFSFPYPFPGYEKYYIPNEVKVSQAIDKIMSV
ncbi:MAG: alpha-ketoacid dehydrogenase subunit beta [Candidatus Micrarchaeota archaeon]|nr:alpha-ketoacid dehydrogenase subunit beta [Candidatus Micrarchaeota archaeon]MDE1833968.1 alpha-ketoacid dehydrogenase subunit beta [Candidatus Micrarchaeota archaeon]MDE1859831.1 alpha-ketoacid dehydrogenase subunit beta [Candidatus Micrarchaeota archaeon]